MHLINSFDLVLVNGAMKREGLGKSVSLSNSGASTIDYVVLSHNLVGLVYDFKVDCLSIYLWL